MIKMFLDILPSAIQPFHINKMNSIEFFNTHFTNYEFPGNQEDYFGPYLYESDSSLETVTRYLQNYFIIICKFLNLNY
jgi:hypothetical protein